MRHSFKSIALGTLSIATLTAGLGGLPNSLMSAAHAQDNAAPYKSATRYDIKGRIVGTIAPDPDGNAVLKHAATRTAYDVRGNPTKVETGELSSWKNETIAPKNWSGFTVLTTANSAYDIMGRKIKDWVVGSNGVTVSMTQYSYDGRGNVVCTAQRMNPARYNNLPASACTLGTPGSQGPDRITRNYYDEANRIVQIRRAVGTNIEQSEVTYTYTPNGQKETVTDANGNKAEYRYDEYDRLNQWRFPDKANKGASSTTDYESYGYDDNGNRTLLKKRDGSIITYRYDALNRNTAKIIPERAGLHAVHTRDVYYAYDLRGLQTHAGFHHINGHGVLNTYDGFGRMTSARHVSTGFLKHIYHAYDDNGNRTEVRNTDTYSTFSYDYDGLNRVKKIYNGTGVGDKRYLIQTLTYNQRSLLKGTLERYATRSNYSYDAVGRTTSIGHDLRNTVDDVTYGFGFNAASQISNRSTSNDAYIWDGDVNVSRNYAVNGLNQYTSAGSKNLTYDKNGNLTSDGTTDYLYDIENRLVQAKDVASGAIKTRLYYDPLGRLFQSDAGNAASTTKYLYDGDALIAEYNSAGTRLRNYGHGTGVDDVLWSYEWGEPATRARFYHKNHQGSITAVTSYGGTPITINSYDEYGIPAATNLGRFQYTGQIWLPELEMYYYKARIYSPTLGRFLQTDPIGYEDQYNLYAYVGNDPINLIDPTGLCGSRVEGYNSSSCRSSTDVGFNKDESNSSQSLLSSNDGGGPDYGSANNTYDPDNPVGSDGILSLNEANQHARYGNGETIEVDATKLDVTLYEEEQSESDNTVFGARVTGTQGRLVYNGVSVKFDPKTRTFSILPDRYDFDQQPGRSTARNIATAIGEGVATAWGTFRIKPFQINFKGQPNVKFIRK